MKEENGEPVVPPQNKIQDSIDVIDMDEGEGYIDPLSPMIVRGQRVAMARDVLGLKDQRDSGDQVGFGAAADHRTTDVAKVLQLLQSNGDTSLRKALQRLHVKWYQCETERLQSLLGAAGSSSKVCSFVPQVAHACQVCREWRRPGNANKLTYSLAQSFNEEVQFDLLFYRSLLQPTSGGDKGIPVVHFIDCCIRWSACSMSPTRGTVDCLNCIYNSWVTIFGAMKTFTMDGKVGCELRR